MPNLDCAGGTLSYSFHRGNLKDPTITLVNGHLRPRTDFRMFSKYLSVQGFSVLTFDNRGAGETQTTRAFSLDDMVGDIFLLWDHLNIDRSHLVGLSMGGFIAQACAHLHPSRLDSLSLVSTGLDLDDLRLDAGPWPSDHDGIKQRLARYFHCDFPKKNRLLLDAMVKQMAQRAHSGELNHSADGQRQALAGYCVEPCQAVYGGPTLIVHGRDDRIIPPDAANRLAAHYPASKLVLFDKAGHLLLAEAGQRLYEEIALFTNSSDR